MATIGTETKKINHKSDFDFNINLKALSADGNYVEVDFPTYDFVGYLYTRSNAKYEFSYKDGVPTNCFNDNGKIHVVANAHNLLSGVLKIQLMLYIPNEIYPDGTKLSVSDCETSIELVDGCGDDFEGSIEFIAPFIKGEKGDKGDNLTWGSMLQEEQKEVIDDAVAEIKKEQITTLAQTDDKEDYNDVF